MHLRCISFVDIYKKIFKLEGKKQLICYGDVIMSERIVLKQNLN